MFGLKRGGNKMEIIAVKERSAGNESVGSMWIETKVFCPETPVIEIIDWSQPDKYGRLIITIANE